MTKRLYGYWRKHVVQFQVSSWNVEIIDSLQLRDVHLVDSPLLWQADFDYFSLHSISLCLGENHWRTKKSPGL
jgi:hypothetical protein